MVMIGWIDTVIFYTQIRLLTIILSTRTLNNTYSFCKINYNMTAIIFQM